MRERGGRGEGVKRVERNNWEGRCRMGEERPVSEWGDEGKVELYIRVTALLCKTSQQGERKREGKGVCVGGRYI